MTDLPIVQAYDRFCRMEQVPRDPKIWKDKEGRRYQYWYVAMTRNAKMENRKKIKVFLEPTPHAVINQNIQLKGWYQPKHISGSIARRRPCYTEALLTQPYGGACPIRCVMCYINNGVRGYRGQGLTVVDPEYPDKIRKQLAGMRTASAFYISSLTEPFQPIEKIYHNTQRTAQVAIDAGLPLFFLTRQAVPDWAIEQLQKHPLSYHQISITTPDPKDWKLLCPGAAPLDVHLKRLKDVHDAGVYTSIQVDPIIPGITSIRQVVQLIEMLADHGADHLIFKFVEAVLPAKGSLVRRLREVFGDRVQVFEDLFVETIGGVCNIKEHYRLSAFPHFLRACTKHHLTMSLCFEFMYERDTHGAIVDHRGIVVTHPTHPQAHPEYLTADQCHGRRVPMYTRETVDAPWEGVVQCPPSGCLYCEETCGQDEPPCGNSAMFQAGELVAKHFRLPVIP